ncbi:hypothetical protein VZT92_002553 [Zoarces viviparus]|uniref:Uncharacterized protein n=1 Tax=Zoarces viviparus TaxID=48416 RepID=A0AAW1G0F8_ZOAVI
MRMCGDSMRPSGENTHIGKRTASRFRPPVDGFGPFFFVPRGFSQIPDALTLFSSGETLIFSRKTLCGRRTGFAPSSALLPPTSYYQTTFNPSATKEAGVQATDVVFQIFSPKEANHLYTH